MPILLRDPSKSIRNGEIEIFYSHYGEGPLTVLLHGFPDNEGTYAAQVADFARDHLVVAPRLRGFPPSSIPSDVESYALPIVAEDVAALVEHFGQGPAIVVGHDWGGALAQAVALRFPSLVTSLILLNTPILSTFNAVVTNDPEQQAMSAYTLPYLRYQSGDDKNIAFVTRNIRDPGWRATISRYLEQNSIEGMMTITRPTTRHHPTIHKRRPAIHSPFRLSSFGGPKKSTSPPASWMAWRDTTRPHCAL
jgi:pimeloyl-ACP methyl ester carboxylesterase